MPKQEQECRPRQHGLRRGSLKSTSFVGALSKPPSTISHVTHQLPCPIPTATQAILAGGPAVSDQPTPVPLRQGLRAVLIQP